MGADKAQLLRQFLLESVLLNALGIVLAFTLVQLTLPYFRQLTGLDLSLTLWYDPLFWVGLVSLFVAGTVLSGLYPAVVLSSFNPVTVLKGSGTGFSWRRGIGLRQGLVVFQFAACIVLIVGTAAVYLQTEYMRNQDLGIDAEHTLVLKGPRLVGDSTTQVNRWQEFRQAVRETGLVREITTSDALPSRELTSWTYLSLAGNAGQPNTREDVFPIVVVDADFFRAFDIKLLAGRTFSSELSSDTRTVVLNEEAAKHFGFTDPHRAINQRLSLGDEKITVIGVIENFHHQLRDAYLKTVFVYNPVPGRYFSLQINTGNEPTAKVKQTLARVEKQWKKTYPGNPFDYFFLDDSFDVQYRADQNFGHTVALFAFLTILVACLGLFGLASFTTMQRTREIGIRKALGATMGSVLFLLSRDFLRLVLLANLLAWPLAYWAVRKWLQGYAFPIALSPWLFILPTVAVLLIALLTVGYKTWQAARQNPVKSLRHE
jgi:putative ABC transport system permease protein